MREVVEWVEEYAWHAYGQTHRALAFDMSAWQSKLKEWGIKYKDEENLSP